MHYYFGESEALWKKDGYPEYKTDNGPFSYAVRLVGGFSIRGPPGLRFQHSVKRLEDERMKEKYTDSVQNRFTAYLVAAVTNKRIHYMKYKMRLQEQEFLQVDLQEKHYLDFDRQYHDYIGEQTEFIMEDWERFQNLLILLESEKLMKAVNRLKERERKLLFARVFGEFTFTELGDKFGMKPKQAEMAYYYVIRKLRKELEVNRKHEF